MLFPQNSAITRQQDTHPVNQRVGYTVSRKANLYKWKVIKPQCHKVSLQLLNLD